MNPKETYHTVNTYINLVENEINALMKQPIKKLKSNLINKEYIVMEKLAKKKDLIITRKFPEENLCQSVTLRKL